MTERSNQKTKQSTKRSITHHRVMAVVVEQLMGCQPEGDQREKGERDDRVSNCVKEASPQIPISIARTNGFSGMISDSDMLYPHPVVMA